MNQTYLTVASGKKQQGFTLIELMITVAIIAILAAVAIPSYQEHVVTSNRAVAQAFMAEIANRQKQYMIDARSYTSDLTTAAGLNMTAPSEVTKHYPIANIVITCTNSDGTNGCTIVNGPPTFTIRATPTSTQQISDGWMSLTSDGTKASEHLGKWK